MNINFYVICIISQQVSWDIWNGDMKWYKKGTMV